MYKIDIKKEKVKINQMHIVSIKDLPKIIHHHLDYILMMQLRKSSTIMLAFCPPTDKTLFVKNFDCVKVKPLVYTQNDDERGVEFEMFLLIFRLITHGYYT